VGIVVSERLPLTFPQFLAGDLGAALPHGPGWLMPLSVGLAVAGLAAAWAVYQRGLVPAAALARAFGPLARAAEQGYGLDTAYAAAYRAGLLGLATAVGWVDRYLVDGVVNAASAGTLRAGARLRAVQTGRAQDYLYGVAAGLFLLVVILAWS
jgi:NADH-quinone oxidoreductase subunit L